MSRASRMNWLVLTLVVVILCFNVTAFSQENDSQTTKEDKAFAPSTLQGDPKELVSFVIEGMRRERLKLTSGACRFEGSLTHNRPMDSDNDLTGPVTGCLAFENGKLRYDITRPGWVVDSSTIKPTPGKESRHVTASNMKGFEQKKFADDGLRLTVWSTDQGFAVISKPEGFPNGRVFSEYVDIRAATLFDRLAITRGWALDEVFTNLQETASRNDPEVNEVADSIWRITWQMRDQNWATRWILTIDTRHFTPQEYRCESVERKKMSQADAWLLEWRNRTQWDERNGVWIPLHHEYHSPHGPFSRVTETLVFDYRWESVNAPVDNKLFTYESFDLPTHIGIQDVSGEKPVLVRAPIGRSPSTPPMAPLPSDRRSKIPLIIGINVVALIVVLVLARRHRNAVNRRQETRDVESTIP